VSEFLWHQLDRFFFEKLQNPTCIIFGKTVLLTETKVLIGGYMKTPTCKWVLTIFLKKITYGLAATTILIGHLIAGLFNPSAV
jgi:hypothetical protein